MIDEQEAHTQVLDWLDEERVYTLEKFGTDKDRFHVEEFVAREHPIDNEWWTMQLDNYYHRAHVLGIDNPNGRQALAKFVATAVGMLAATVQVYGPLPEPGVPSGEIK